MEILEILFNAIVFPGLLFFITLSLFCEWYIRKFVARLQNRMGPTYVGPLGVLQPFADFVKLLFVKSEIRQRYSYPLLAKVALCLGIGFIIASLFLTPITSINLWSPYDIIVFMYLFVVWSAMVPVLVGLAYPNPFTAAGVSRLLALLTVIEPAWIGAILVPVILASKMGAEYSLLRTIDISWKLWLNPFTAALMALAFVVYVIASQAKTMLKPFDIPEAEQEVIAGHITELSGPVLALYNLFHDMEITFCSLLATYLFLAGPYPFENNIMLGTIMIIIKFFAILTLMSIIRASMGRLRIDQAMASILKYGVIPVLAAALLANIYIIF